MPKKSVGPGQNFACRCGNDWQPIGRHLTERSCTTESVYCSPDRVAGHLWRISKIEERTRRERRVQEVFPSTAKHLFADYDTKTNPERSLPERNIGWHDEGKKYRRDEKSFVDLVFTLNSKQHFPETTRHEDDEVDWQIMRRAINHIVPETLWIMPGD